MTYNFITIGGATRDVSFFTDQGVMIDNHRDVLRQKLLAFESGAKIKVDKFYYSFGGGAANAAVNLAHFGFKTACLAAVGADEGGKEIIANLRQRGVKTELVEKSRGEESGTAFDLIDPSGERILFVERGANRKLAISALGFKSLKKVENIYLASLSGEWAKTLERIFAAVDVKKTKVVWNPGGKQLERGLKFIQPFLKKTYVFALNKDEALELVLSSQKHKHLNYGYLNKTENLLKIIFSFGPRLVLITAGTGGAFAYDGLKTYYRPIMPETKRVDTTGIGDIFNSTFAAGLEIYQGDINQALRLASKNTASKISHLGAQNGLMNYKIKK